VAKDQPQTLKSLFKLQLNVGSPISILDGAWAYASTILSLKPILDKGKASIPLHWSGISLDTKEDLPPPETPETTTILPRNWTASLLWIRQVQ
jgi:hypothetical protein